MQGTKSPTRESGLWVHGTQAQCTEEGNEDGVGTGQTGAPVSLPVAFVPQKTPLETHLDTIGTHSSRGRPGGSSLG